MLLLAHTRHRGAAPPLEVEPPRARPQRKRLARRVALHADGEHGLLHDFLLVGTSDPQLPHHWIRQPIHQGAVAGQAHHEESPCTVAAKMPAYKANRGFAGLWPNGVVDPINFFS